MNIPALGCPIAEHDPIKIVIGLTLCDKCFEIEKPRNFLSVELRHAITRQTIGRATPDFNRAWLVKIPFDSPDWKALKETARCLWKVDDVEKKIVTGCGNFITRESSIKEVMNFKFHFCGFCGKPLKFEGEH